MAGIVRSIGQLQFRYPVLQKPINFTAQILMRLLGTRILCGELKGLRINAIGANPGFLLGTSEALEQSLIAKFLTVGDVVYDVGANIGFYCLLGARRVGPTGKIYAFEPTPTLVSRIKENAALNSFDQIEVVQAAVCDRTGTLDFCVEGDLSVSNGIRKIDNESKRLTVPCTRIDDFAINHLPPKLILIDIEGAELEALQGAMQTISTHRPILMIEVHWLGKRFLDFVEERLVPLGYVATTYDGQPLPEGHVRYHCLLVAN